MSSLPTDTPYAIQSSCNRIDKRRRFCLHHSHSSLHTDIIFESTKIHFIEKKNNFEFTKVDIDGLTQLQCNIINTNFGPSH
jgi:hypothetical protein